MFNSKIFKFIGNVIDVGNTIESADFIKNSQRTTSDGGKVPKLENSGRLSEAFITGIDGDIVYDVYGKVTSYTDKSVTPNLTYSITYEFDRIKTIVGNGNTHTFTWSKDGQLLNITRT